MKSLETFIQEARKNPDQNPKIPINDIIDDYHKKAKNISGSYIKNAFASFTNINKLGINPKSKYDTPLGIYAYPLDYILDEVGDWYEMTKLPFAGGNPFVNLFEIKGNLVILNGLSQSDLSKYYLKLGDYYSKTLGAKKGSTEWKSAVDELETWIVDAPTYALINSNGGRLWYVTMKMSWAITEFYGKSSKSSSIVWNKIFREIGIDAALDMGDGVIHSNEPHQLVVFNPRSIRNVKRFDNKYSPQSTEYSIKTGDTGKMLSDLMINNPTQYVRYVKSDYFRLQNLIPTNSKKYKFLFDRIFKDNFKSTTIEEFADFLKVLFLNRHITDEKLVIYLYEKAINSSGTVRSKLLLNMVPIFKDTENLHILIKNPKLYKKLYPLLDTHSKYLINSKVFIEISSLVSRYIPDNFNNKETINFVLENALDMEGRDTLKLRLEKLLKLFPERFDSIEPKLMTKIIDFLGVKTATNIEDFKQYLKNVY
jgi:hypothetical protein